MRIRNGLTLIEVILTIAIMGIIALPILTIFNSGIKNIVNAGKRTEDVFIQKESIDSKIIANEKSGNGVDVINVTIPGVINNEPIIGRILISDPDSDKKIITFVPNWGD